MPPAPQRAAGLAVAHAPWPRIAAALATGATAVLPVGAGAKEHGAHLPAGTDQHQAEWLTRRLLARRTLVAWPVLSYGYYPVFVDYPGSISLARDSFVRVAREILRGIAYAGARRVAVLNTGISTREPLREAAAILTVPWRVVDVYAGPRFDAVKAATARQRHGGHADEIETALMLAIAPRLVDLAQAGPPGAPIARGLFNRADPDGPNYCPDGVNGDPRAATRAQGRRLWHALLADVQAELDALEEGT